MKVGIVTNMEGVKENILAELCNELEKNGFTPVFCQNHIPKCCDHKEKADFKQMLLESEFIIALGGDGTIVHAAMHASLFDKKVLGINCGRLGYTAGLESNELHMIDRLKNGDYEVCERMMLDVEVKFEGSSNVYHSLNDAVISRGSLSRIIDINVKFNDADTIKYRSDGLIVSTPTGSTAYSISAGGPVVDPDIEGILITPICDHSVHNRPMILNSNTKIEVSTAFRNGSEVYLTVDGQKGILLEENAVVRITKSSHTAKLINIKSDTFLQVLQEKIFKRGSN